MKATLKNNSKAAIMTGEEQGKLNHCIETIKNTGNDKVMIVGAPSHTAELAGILIDTMDKDSLRVNLEGSMEKAKLKDICEYESRLTIVEDTTELAEALSDFKRRSRKE